MRLANATAFLPSPISAARPRIGNHGRSVAWGAKLAGCKAQIYIHAGVSVHREKAMQELGATVIRVDGNYDASLAALRAVSFAPQCK